MHKLIGLLFIFIPSALLAQDAPEYSREWTSIEIVLSVSMLVFTLVLIIVEAMIIMKAEKSWAPASILKVLGLTLIICISALLVIAGYGKDQIGPVMGLLGVVAGYLLGDNKVKTTG